MKFLLGLASWATDSRDKYDGNQTDKVSTTLLLTHLFSTHLIFWLLFIYMYIYVPTHTIYNICYACRWVVVTNRRITKIKFFFIFNSFACDLLHSLANFFLCQSNISAYLYSNNEHFLWILEKNIYRLLSTPFRDCPRVLFSFCLIHLLKPASGC